MKIYEIDQAILDLIDLETGEILDFEEFEKLNLEKDTKIENMALWVKELRAEAEAIKAEEKSLAERRKSNENKISSLEGYIKFILNGQKFSTPKVAITFRNNKCVEIEDESDFIEHWKDKENIYLKYAEPKISKTEIKNSINSGIEVYGAKIAENSSMTIK